MVTYTIEICLEEKLRNAFLCKVTGRSRVTHGQLSYSGSSHSPGVYAHDPVWHNLVHGWPQKYWLFLVHTHLSCHLHFFWFGRSFFFFFFTSVRSAALVSCVKILIIFLTISHNLCSLPQDRVALMKHVFLSLCLFDQECNPFWAWSQNRNWVCYGGGGEWSMYVLLYIFKESRTDKR